MKRWKAEERALKNYFTEQVALEESGSSPEKPFPSRSRGWLEILGTVAAGVLLLTQLNHGFLAEDLSRVELEKFQTVVELFLEVDQ